ncbi:MAG: hemerythrin [Methylotenera sp.]|nr:MAG: hemerythrin [Methylotenera sp.]
MRTTTKSSTRSTKASNATSRVTSRSATVEDAVSILTDDHDKVKKLFKQFEKHCKADNTEAKVETANMICMELTVHAMAEEEIFYPAARMAIKDDDLLNEAEVEHDSAKELIAQIQFMESDNPMYDAKVTVLGEYIDHHITEEEEEMFPKVRKAKVDLEELGEQLMMRKEELMAEIMSANGQINIEVLKQHALDAVSKKH